LFIIRNKMLVLRSFLPADVSADCKNGRPAGPAHANALAPGAAGAYTRRP
jgi:hypothetical protein